MISRDEIIREKEDGFGTAENRFITISGAKEISLLSSPATSSLGFILIRYQWPAAKRASQSHAKHGLARTFKRQLKY